MTPELAVDLLKQLVERIFIVASPLLLTAMITGLIVSLIQTITSLQISSRFKHDTLHCLQSTQKIRFSAGIRTVNRSRTKQFKFVNRSNIKGI